jgi:hypothetical protein
MSKHTKGPWHVFKDSSIYSKHADYTLAEIVAGMTDEECDANARLIAAAPELLEALQRLCADELHTQEKWNNARAAIAKATGEQK